MSIAATFSVDVNVGIAPLVVAFTYTLTAGTAAEVASALWDFGDGTTSTEFNPSHTYTTTGYHTVILILTDINTNEVVVRRPAYIRTGTLTFTANETKGTPPLGVTFMNASFAPTGYHFTGWDWNYGDGSVHGTGETGAAHTYSDYGNYNVILGANMFKT